MAGSTVTVESLFCPVFAEVTGNPGLSRIFGLRKILDSDFAGFFGNQKFSGTHLHPAVVQGLLWSPASSQAEAGCPCPRGCFSQSHTVPLLKGLGALPITHSGPCSRGFANHTQCPCPGGFSFHLGTLCWAVPRLCQTLQDSSTHLTRELQHLTLGGTTATGFAPST